MTSKEKVRVIHETRRNVEEIAPPATSRTGLCIGEVSTYLPHRAKKDHARGQGYSASMLADGWG